MRNAHSREAFNGTERELRTALIRHTHRLALTHYLGRRPYRELRALALAAEGRKHRAHAPRVYILPGIMGSRLGHARQSARRSDIVWIEPTALAEGRIVELALPRGARLRPLDVQQLLYLKLKLSLELAGFDVIFHCYDWRRSIDRLGHELATRIRHDPARSIAVIGHSMGGLVTRAAMKQDRHSKVSRLITLGTPSYGSFAAVLALRGVYPPVRVLASLDRAHDPVTHAHRVFATFPGLHQLLPAPERYSVCNLYKTASWPGSGPAPRQRLLSAVARVRRGLAPPDERFVQVIGVDRDTVTGLTIRNDEFEFAVSRAGDGTVPIDLAMLEQVPTYYAGEGHSELPSNEHVIAALVELLSSGSTERLMRNWEPTAQAPHIVITESELRAAPLPRHDWAHMTWAERRALFAGLAFPE